MSVSRRAFDEAIALGHHWVGEEHYLLALLADDPSGLALLAPLGLTHPQLRSAVTAHFDAVGPPLAKKFDGCVSAPSYHAILGRAEGFALGSGRAVPGPVEVLAALFWDPLGVPSRLLARVGSARSAALDIVSGSGWIVPSVPTTNLLPFLAQREAVALGHAFVGDVHVVLALLAGLPDDRGGAALRRAGLSHDRLAAWFIETIAHADPPAPPATNVSSATLNPRCHQLVGRSEGLAATLGDGVVRSTEALIAYLWQDSGQPVVMLEAQPTSATAVLAKLAEIGIDVPEVALPQPDRTPWGEKVIVPLERMNDVVARLSADLTRGTWGCNSHDGRGWVVAHASVDLIAIVAKVLSA